MKTRKRSHCICLRLNDKEYKKLCKLTEKAKLPRETVLRNLICGCVIMEAPPMEYRELVCELRRLGNILNQLARASHRNGFVDAKAHEKAIESIYEFEDKWSNLYFPETKN